MGGSGHTERLTNSPATAFRIGGLCEKRVTLLVTLRVRSLVPGIAGAWQPPSSSRPGPSGTGPDRLDADGEERR